MKKKAINYVLLFIVILLVACTMLNIYKWIVSGKQNIKISTTTKAYTNSDLYVSIVAQKNKTDLETRNSNKTYR